MSDLVQRLERARAVVHPAWDDARSERVRASIPRRQRRKTIARVGAATLGLALALGVASRVRNDAHDESVAAHTDAPVDAPTITPASASSGARLVARSTDREVYEVTAGRVRFDVPHRPSRVFRVEAGAVSVQVLGTSFSVERTVDGAVVSVSDGRVRVFWNNHFADLGAGETDRFPRATQSVSPTRDEPAPEPTAEAPSAVVTRPHAAPAPSPEALMDEADEARRQGDSARAATLLRRALSAPRPDAAAAFTLGRVLADDLHRHDEAAAAFARARSIAPRGPLSDDALAREVVCLVRAEERSRAEALVEAYLRDHPAGALADRLRAAIAR